ncbi:hypothetical protein BsIDN1_37940 [Bacillus safensis]|uniref:Uncharacterized protein n=1 Tax=Bacillus safensis TaxID=561879 RepID=A0A5S9MF19_BACIA|nr:hypothetical protein BsIDN1_37940 [Bacillus safensis]
MKNIANTHVEMSCDQVRAFFLDHDGGTACLSQQALEQMNKQLKQQKKALAEDLHGEYVEKGANNPSSSLR